MQGVLSILSTLARFVPALVPILTVAGVAGGLAYAITKDVQITLVVSCGAMLTMILVAILRAVLKRKRTKSFEDNLSAQRSAIKAQAKENLQEVRSKFLETLEVLRSNESGKDYLYTVPWYVIFGEPASGKTTTIKSLANTGIRFLGTGDKMRGIGGTANCDWWFSDHAVILDTAGRWAIPEELAPDKAEWEGFLGLLSKFRPRQPINGAIVVIPTDRIYPRAGLPEAALLADAKEKGEQLRDRLDKLQSHLKVSFPVYVLVTKADHIEGFEDFFVYLPAAYQTTLFGWSNPHDLDQRYDSKWLSEAYQSMGRDLERARYYAFSMESMSFDSAPRVFLFPREFERTKPLLNAYLEAMFSRLSYEKNVFLRGIYFTSGHQEREGGQTHVQTMSQSSLADSGMVRFDWAPRPYFIHDFYKEKVFREKGLVRPHARELKRRLLTRRVALIAAIVVLLIGLVWSTIEILGQVGLANEANQSLVDLKNETPTLAQVDWFRDRHGITNWEGYANDVKRLPTMLASLLPISEDEADRTRKEDLGSIVTNVLGRVILQPPLDHLALNFPYHRHPKVQAAKENLQIEFRDYSRSDWNTLVGQLPPETRPWMQDTEASPKQRAEALVAFAESQLDKASRLTEHGESWGSSDIEMWAELLPRKEGETLKSLLVDEIFRNQRIDFEQSHAASLALARHYDVRMDLFLHEFEELFREDLEQRGREAIEQARAWVNAQRTFVEAKTFESLKAWIEAEPPSFDPDATRDAYGELLGKIPGSVKHPPYRWSSDLDTIARNARVSYEDTVSKLRLLRGTPRGVEVPAAGRVAVDPESPEGETRFLFDAEFVEEWKKARTLFDTLSENHGTALQSPITTFERTLGEGTFHLRTSPDLAALERVHSLIEPLAPARDPSNPKSISEIHQLARLVLLDKLCAVYGTEFDRGGPLHQAGDELVRKAGFLERSLDVSDFLPSATPLSPGEYRTLFEDLAALEEDDIGYLKKVIEFLSTLPEIPDMGSTAARDFGGYLNRVRRDHDRALATALRGHLFAQTLRVLLPAGASPDWDPIDQASAIPSAGNVTPNLLDVVNDKRLWPLAHLPEERNEAHLQWLADLAKNRGTYRAIPQPIKDELDRDLLGSLRDLAKLTPKKAYALHRGETRPELPAETSLERDRALLREAARGWYEARLADHLAVKLHEAISKIEGLNARPFFLRSGAPSLDLAGIQGVYASWKDLRDRWTLLDADEPRLPSWLEAAFDPAEGKTTPGEFLRETEAFLEKIHPVLFATDGATAFDWAKEPWQTQALAEMEISLKPVMEFPLKLTVTIETADGEGSMAQTSQSWGLEATSKFEPVAPQKRTRVKVAWDHQREWDQVWIDQRPDALAAEGAPPEDQRSRSIANAYPEAPRGWYLFEWLETLADEPARTPGSFRYTVPMEDQETFPFRRIVIWDPTRPRIRTLDISSSNPARIEIYWKHSLDGVYGKGEDARKASERVRDLGELMSPKKS